MKKKKICPSCREELSFWSTLTDFKTPGFPTARCSKCKSIIKFKLPWWQMVLMVIGFIPVGVGGLAVGFILAEVILRGGFRDFTTETIILLAAGYIVFCLLMGLGLGTLAFFQGTITIVPEKPKKSK